MSRIEERISKLEYHIELLLKQAKVDQFPFDLLVIRAQLDREDVTDIMNLCEKLSMELKKQKAEGFVTFTPLLTKFKQGLHPNLPLEQTIHALLAEGKYELLMTEFLQLMKK